MQQPVVQQAKTYYDLSEAARHLDLLWSPSPVAVRPEISCRLVASYTLYTAGPMSVSLAFAGQEALQWIITVTAGSLQIANTVVAIPQLPAVAGRPGTIYFLLQARLNSACIRSDVQREVRSMAVVAFLLSLLIYLL